MKKVIFILALVSTVSLGSFAVAFDSNQAATEISKDGDKKKRKSKKECCSTEEKAKCNTSSDKKCCDKDKKAEEQPAK